MMLRLVGLMSLIVVISCLIGFDGICHGVETCWSDEPHSRYILFDQY